MLIILIDNRFNCKLLIVNCKLSIPSFYEFLRHKLGLSALFRVGFQEIREEKHLQNREHNEKFNQDNRPQRFAERHIAESVVIQVENPIPKAVFSHGLIV